MKREMFIITVLIGNIAFAAPLPLKNRAPREVKTSKEETKKVFRVVSKHLIDKGLEAGAAFKKVSSALQGDERMNALMIKNIVEGFEHVKYEDVIAHIGESALFEKRVDLSDYEHIIALLQRKNNRIINKKLLQRAKQVATQNKTLISRCSFT
jgi:hypothetical protein